MINSLISDALVKKMHNKKKSPLDVSIQLYQAGEITLGRASELAGMHRFEFESALKERGISKVVDAESAEKLKEGVSVIKSYHKNQGQA